MAKKASKRAPSNEELELENAYNQVAEKKKTKKKNGGIITAIVLCVIALVALLGVMAGYFTTGELEYGIIMDGVRVAGIDVGGMTKEEALSAITPAISDYKEKTMVVTVLDQEVELPSDLTEVSLNAEEAVEAAYSVGRSGPRSKQKEQQLQALTTGIDADLTECFYVNRDAIAAKLNLLGISPSSDLDPSGWEVTGKQPDLSAEEAPADNQMLVINLGTPEYRYDQEDLIDQIIAAFQTGRYRVEYDAQLVEPDPIDLDAIYEETFIAPVEPVID